MKWRNDFTVIVARSRIWIIPFIQRLYMHTHCNICASAWSRKHMKLKWLHSKQNTTWHVCAWLRIYKLHASVDGEQKITKRKCNRKRVRSTFWRQLCSIERSEMDSTFLERLFVSKDLISLNGELCHRTNHVNMPEYFSILILIGIIVDEDRCKATNIGRESIISP